MTQTREQAVRQTPAAVRVVMATLLFLGVTSLLGGLAMISSIGPDDFVPSAWLDDIPLVESWVVPGIVLAVGFGFGSILVYLGMRRRWSWPWAETLIPYHWSWLGTILLGLGHVIWIGLELVYLPALSPLQFVYGAVGLMLLALPFLPGVRNHLRLDR